MLRSIAAAATGIIMFLVSYQNFHDLKGAVITGNSTDDE